MKPKSSSKVKWNECMVKRNLIRKQQTMLGFCLKNWRKIWCFSEVQNRTTSLPLIKNLLWLTTLSKIWKGCGIRSRKISKSVQSWSKVCIFSLRDIKTFGQKRPKRLIRSIRKLQICALRKKYMKRWHVWRERIWSEELMKWKFKRCKMKNENLYCKTSTSSSKKSSTKHY